MFGLDVTHQVLADDHVIERFESINNPVAQFVVELLQFFKKTYKTHFNMDGGQYMMLVQFCICYNQNCLQWYLLISTLNIKVH